MASFQKLTLSEKVPPNHPSWKKVNFLDMSLDDIIIYKELEGTNAEEEKNKRQNHSKKESPSRQQSKAHRHRHRRGEVQ
ncbi:LUZP4 isoform 1 [Pan troglodytes]|uniref:LUZP4 isoform 1 n=3 Tax=Pan TaxID=9596 RepID=A0A6D2X0E7_PANTR|nr:LUZP4 isoform 1 [Pan troglodytes]